MKRFGLKSCPRCGKSGRKLIIWSTYDGTLACKIFGKYYIECPTCHTCSRSKATLWRAKLNWNRLENRNG